MHKISKSLQEIQKNYVVKFLLNAKFLTPEKVSWNQPASTAALLNN
jgi:hypothetical protein